MLCSLFSKKKVPLAVMYFVTKPFPLLFCPSRQAASQEFLEFAQLVLPFHTALERGRGRVAGEIAELREGEGPLPFFFCFLPPTVGKWEAVAMTARRQRGKNQGTETGIHLHTFPLTIYLFFYSISRRTSRPRSTARSSSPPRP